MIHSNAPWTNSGYGKQTRLFASRIRDLGHDVAISAFWGLQGGVMKLDGMSVFPRGLDAYGNDVLELHAKEHFGRERDGVVLPLTDIWVLRAEVLAELNVAAWVPVDHEPCQPPTVGTLRQGKCLPIAMSRFGERMLVEEGFRPVYVPHGCEASVFAPRDRVACREALQIPKDAFLVGIVAANQGHRKSYPQMLRAFRIFQERHPEALLYVHTWLGPEHQGLDLRLLIEQELDRDSVLVCDQYRYEMGHFTDDYLAQGFNAMDVMMNAAQGEGFGVTIIEAQASGTPVILTNATSMPELCGSGWLVNGTPIYTQFASWQLLPDVEQLVAALEECYAQSEAERLEGRARARAFGERYDADRVTAEFWVPALQEIEDRLLTRRQPARKRGRRRS